MKDYFKNVLFIGPNKNLRGGIASVLQVYSQSIPHFNFISSYNDKNIVYNFFYFINTIFKFTFKLIKDRNIKIVHLHSASRGSFFRKSVLILIAKVFGKKTVLHIHGSEFKIFYHNTGQFRFLIRYILNTSDEVVCLSDEWKVYYDSIIGARVKKSIVVNNPAVLPENVKRTVPGKPIIVLYLNRIGVKKGAFDLLECFRLNKAELAGTFKLIFAGAGETDELLEFINKHELGEIVEYKGWIVGKEKDELIESCDVFVLPSYNEGLPMAILESMSFGKPIIATPVGGVPRVVKPGENGWMPEPGDIDGLTNVFKEIKADPAILTKYGDRSLEIVKDYSPEKVNGKLNEIYKGLLK